MYADVDGNIGYHAAGKLPSRRNYRGDVPVDGSSGNFEWDGYIPFDELPSVYNPPSGIIVTANQNPFPENYPYPVNGNFAPPYRAQQIRALLSARNGWRAGGHAGRAEGRLLGLQPIPGRAAGGAPTKSARRTIPDLDDAVALLRDWNGQMDKDLAAPFLITLAVPARAPRRRRERAPPATGMAYEFNMAPAVVERLLRERPAGWFADYDEMLLRALVDAVEEGRRMQGRDLKRWRYGDVSAHRHQQSRAARDAAGRQVLRYRAGADERVDHHREADHRTLAPSMRMNADLGDWDRSLLNIPIGQSGQILSSHYKDQWDGLLQRPQLPHAIRQSGCREHAAFNSGKPGSR